MREFRGKRINGEWVYGWYMQDGRNGIPVILPCGSENITDFIEVIPESVGQYTGLKDCKRTKEYPEGQKIYEGDWVVQIIDVDDGKPIGYSQKEELKFEGVVIWEQCGFALDTKGDGVAEIDLVYQASLEIIGNKTDNPELLETKQDD